MGYTCPKQEREWTDVKKVYKPYAYLIVAFGLLALCLFFMVVDVDLDWILRALSSYVKSQGSDLQPS